MDKNQDDLARGIAAYERGEYQEALWTLIRFAEGV